MAHATRLIGPIRLAMIALMVVSTLALPACNEETSDDGLLRVTIGGRTFALEPAMDDPTRAKGLAGREEIAEDGGMIFVFPTAQRRYFYMKDCLTDIDIAFLDDSGRVVATYTMAEEEPKREDETEMQYVRRLKQYPSRFPTSVAIELRAGMFADLGVGAGDVIDVDIAALKQRAE